jgi:dihydrodipicolinate synthase/N-acetylneuraminate lyase
MKEATKNFKSKYYGIIPPIITPLTENQELDQENLEKLVEYCLNNGVHGIFTMGSSGEAMCVSKDVWEKTIATVIRLPQEL